mmetsp:Transcript_16645/g.22021  ORF Transcript_16645/g.22021 Transcript_16645/m.22021 type:complete len:92 (-) Transcript_16645:974-1249(-)
MLLWLYVNVLQDKKYTGAWCIKTVLFFTDAIVHVYVMTSVHHSIYIKGGLNGYTKWGPKAGINTGRLSWDQYQSKLPEVPKHDRIKCISKY